MSVSVTIRGDKKLQKRINQIARKAPQKIDTILAKAAFFTHAHAITLIQQSPSSGRQYKRGSITHTASAPGQPPATDTGNLVRNITVSRKDIMYYDIGSRKDAPYGFFLEFGTSNMQPRPWLTPSAIEGRKQIKKEIRRIR